jgi:hypothetical protein
VAASMKLALLLKNTAKNESTQLKIEKMEICGMI